MKDHADKGWRDVWTCAKDAAENEARRIWTTTFSEMTQSPCQYITPMEGKSCSFQTDEPQLFADHMCNHGQNMIQILTCTLGHVNKPRFDTAKSLILVSHLPADHGYYPYKDPTQCLFFRCTTCENFIFLSKGTAEREAHCSGHIVTAVSGTYLYYITVFTAL
jgi:hypothetical protein